jgi:hypothetical protein
MGIVSINEPDGHTWSLTPESINEPPDYGEMVDPPAIDALTPGACLIGDADFTLYVSGTGLYQGSVINFAGHDEPTTLNEDGTLSTGVKPALWVNPVTVQVYVRNGPVLSNELPFTFSDTALASAAHAAHGADPDDLEEEINEAAEEGDFKPVHRGRTKRKK